MMTYRVRSVLPSTSSVVQKVLMIATLEETPRSQLAASGIVVASLEGVNKNYGEVRALRNVNFTVCAGQVVALLGPNGAGKTTAITLLLGLMQRDAGKTREF